MRSLIALLLLASAGAFGWLGYRALSADDAKVALSTPGAEPEAGVAPKLNFRPIETTDFSRIAERPLFSAVRRPPPPEAPGTPLEDPNDHLLFGRYEVAGVVMLGDAAMAMLRDEAGRLIRIRAGDRVETRAGQANVIEITLTALTFEEAGETVVAEIGDPANGSEESAEGSQGQ